MEREQRELVSNDEVQRVDPRLLQPHPSNAKVYGAAEDAAFQAGIDADGILIPLLTSRTNIIISGHRRHAAALALGLPTVPVIVSPLTDPTEILRALLLANQMRDKVHYQRAREFELAMTIQKESAKQRQQRNAGQLNEKLGRTTTAETNMPNLACSSPSGPSRELAAEMFGLKRSTAEKALKTLKAIDRAYQYGYREIAQHIIDEMNNSYHAGYRAALASGFLDLADAHLLTPVAGLEMALWQWNPLTGCAEGCADCPAAAYAQAAPALFLDGQEGVIDDND